MNALAVGLSVTLAVATCLMAGTRAVDRVGDISGGRVEQRARPSLPEPLLIARRRVGETVDRFTARRRFHRTLPRYVEAVARELRGGSPTRLAIVDGAHAAGGAFRVDAERISRRLDAGQTVTEVLRWWGTDRRSPELTQLAMVADTGARVGGELARALDGLAAAMTDQRDVAAEARALSSQARASAVLLVAAPVVFCMVMAGIEPEAIQFLLGTPAGWATLTAAVLLDLAGGYWMYRLTERVR